MQWSRDERNTFLQRLRSESFDLLVIGGGITGAGIALDAANRGLKTALIEQHDFASGTSSRSTKLIHGGLRYLKQLEFALVHEVGSERAVVHRLARHLVVPEKMLLPLYEKRGMGYWLTSLGLKIYDFLARVKLEDRRKMLTRGQTLSAEPLLKPQEVAGGALYAEYRTDDARLTIEIAKRAVQEGALLLNYVRAEDFVYEKSQVAGVRAVDELNKKDLNIRATVVVNAGGPWVDELRVKNKSREGKSLHLTKGVHIVVAYHRLPVRQAIYFDVPDGRMIFAIPRGRVTYIGTTDTDYKENKESVRTTLADVKYLVTAVNETFPSSHLIVADVESTWAGLRPLIHEEGKSASELSRKDEIFESDSGLISIAGGKLTGYRKMAERVVDRIIEAKFGSKELTPCMTENLGLAGMAFHSPAEVIAYTKTVADRTERLGLKGGAGGYLVHLYGKQADEILRIAEAGIATRPELVEGELPETRLTLAELEFALTRECCLRAEDFLVRRTGMLYFDIHRLQRVRAAVFDYFESHLGWDAGRVSEENHRMDELIKGAIEFPES